MKAFSIALVALLLMLSGYSHKVEAAALVQQVKKLTLEEQFEMKKIFAEAGSVVAQFELGVMYEFGEGVSKNTAKAVEWYQKAATQGYARAQHNLGWRYLNGMDVPKDMVKAVEWLQKAADQGEAGAQYGLGLIYGTGDGMPKDLRKAVEWYQKAAAQGYADAQNLLGVMYQEGEGVEKNGVLAYAWFNLAAAQGDDDAKKYRDRLEPLLTTAQRTEGQRLASAWKKGETLQTSVNRSVVAPKPIDGEGDPSQKTRDTDRWKFVSGSLYIDTLSVQVIEGLTYSWFKITSTNDKGNDYKLARLVINCSNNTTAVISIIKRDSSGKVKDNFDIEPSKWKFKSPSPGSSGESMSNAACSYISNTATFVAPIRDKFENNATPKLSNTGSGFVISTNSTLLTNHHVVNGCINLKIRDSSKMEHDVTVVATDAKNDLALLQMSKPILLPAATFRASSSVEAGENVVALGYPLAGILASEVNVSFGYVSATAGLADDTSKLQISAPVQPGNSGGPLLDQSGNLIGVVVEKLDAIKVAKAIGDIPQNINFAVKGEVAQVFLKAHKVKFKTTTATKRMENINIASRGRAFTVLVECYK